MSKNTSISLGDHFEEFVHSKIDEGRYTNASEVIRAGLRLLEEEEKKYYLLKQAIQDGINSGTAENFDAKAYLNELKQRHRLNDKD